MAKAIILNPGIRLYHRYIGELFRPMGELGKAIEANPQFVDSFYKLPTR